MTLYLVDVFEYEIINKHSLFNRFICENICQNIEYDSLNTISYEQWKNGHLIKKAVLEMNKNMKK